MIVINLMIIFLNFYMTIGIFGVKYTNFQTLSNRKKYQKNFSSFSANFRFRAEWKKAEPSWKSFSSSYGSSQLGSDSSLLINVVIEQTFVFWHASDRDVHINDGLKSQK